MQAAIPFPDISPELFSIEIGDFTFALRWYALAYIAGILAGWRMAAMLGTNPRLWPSEAPMTRAQVESLVTYVIIGIVAGGRIGYCLFYQPAYYLTHPLEILAIWQGGMSFHGGFLGVVLGTILFARWNGVRLSSVADIMAIVTTPGLFFGRLANFINAELWGSPSDMSWAVIFPTAAAQDCPGIEGLCARHPSQLYEAALEGVMLGAVLLWLAYRRGWFARPWAMTGAFLAGYGAARMFVELFRQADDQFITPDNPAGHVLRLGEAGLSMGQLLSLPMLLLGVALMLWAHRRA